MHVHMCTDKSLKSCRQITGPVCEVLLEMFIKWENSQSVQHLVGQHPRWTKGRKWVEYQHSPLYFLTLNASSSCCHAIPALTACALKYQPQINPFSFECILAGICNSSKTNNAPHYWVLHWSVLESISKQQDGGWGILKLSPTEPAGGAW